MRVADPLNSEESYAHFHEAIGSAITGWAQVEDSFCDLMSRLIMCSVTGKGLGDAHPEGHWVASRIFYATSNFRARVDLLEAIFCHLIVDSELLEEFQRIQNKASKLYRKRSVLAHSHVWGSEIGPTHIAKSIFTNGASDFDLQQTKDIAQSFRDFAKRVEHLAIEANDYLANRGLTAS